MSECDRIRFQLGGFVLGGLEPDEADEVRAHLAICQTCRHEAEELSELPDLIALAGTAEHAAPADLRQRILGRRPRRGLRVPWYAAAAIALAAALGGATVAGLAERPTPPDTTVALEANEPDGVTGHAALLQLDAGVRIDLDVAGLQPARGYYQVWLEGDAERISAGTFVASTDGAARVRLLCGGRLDAYDQLTVTWHSYRSETRTVAVATGFGT